jgi:polyhydroxybutyrate depolymerase
MRFTIFTIMVFAFLCVMGRQPAVAQDTKELKFNIQDVERRAILVNGNQCARPTVIVLHGGKGNAERMRDRTEFYTLAVQENFAVVFAEGTQWRGKSHAWNTGYLLRGQVGDADDISYFDKLIDILVQEHCADPQRIYMTGASNGAMMTLVYAVQRPKKLAAIAPVVGAMFSFDTVPSVPLPIMLINGAQDEEVPIEGGMSHNPMVKKAQMAPYMPLAETVAFWVRVNHSRSVGLTTQKGTVTTTVYPATPKGAVTVSIVDAQGGHGWPGTGARVGSDNVPIQAFDGAEKVWSFFKKIDNTNLR